MTFVPMCSRASRSIALSVLSSITSSFAVSAALAQDSGAPTPIEPTIVATTTDAPQESEREELSFATRLDDVSSERPTPYAFRLETEMWSCDASDTRIASAETRVIAQPGWEFEVVGQTATTVMIRFYPWSTSGDAPAAAACGLVDDESSAACLNAMLVTERRRWCISKNATASSVSEIARDGVEFRVGALTVPLRLRLPVSRRDAEFDAEADLNVSGSVGLVDQLTPNVSYTVFGFLGLGSVDLSYDDPANPGSVLETEKRSAMMGAGASLSIKGVDVAVLVGVDLLTQNGLPDGTDWPYHGTPWIGLSLGGQLWHTESSSDGENAGSGD